MSRPAVAKIDLSAFTDNYGVVSELVGEVRCVAVVKANGYGHGICQVAGALPDATLAVACVDEALVLRRGGVTNDIIVLEGVFTASEIIKAHENRLQLVVHSDYQIQFIKSFSADDSDNNRLKVWLKINTGMNRLGFRPEHSQAALSELKNCSSVDVIGVMSHFSSADEQDHTTTEKQLQLFNATISSFGAAARGLELSVANSAALIAHNTSHFNQVRPGISLYGSSPFAHRSAASLGLQPVMSLESGIIATHELRAGDCVGYGETWCAARDSRIATIAIGYGDGYPRHAPAGTPVWIGDRLVPLVGRVSMDMITVDLSYHPDASVGDVVELWGKNLSVDEIAQSAGTIGYELLTGVTSRVPREYINPLD